MPRSEGTDLPPRVMLVRHDRSTRAFLGPSLSAEERERLRAIDPETAYEHPERITRLLDGGNPAGWEHVGLFRFRIAPSPEQIGIATRQGEHFVVFQEGRPVAWAWSMREHALAEEAAVETVREFRNRGFGRQALAAWISHVVRSGKIAYYPTPEREVVGGRLASSLGGEQLATMKALP
jgi:hypothetical protein